MKKFLLSFLCFLLVIGGGYAQTYSYTFTSKQFDTDKKEVKLGDIYWKLEGTTSGSSYFGYDKTKGQQFGSGNIPYKSMTLSTSEIAGKITEIVINTSGASSVNASFTVSVGGTQYGNSTKLTATATSYTFTGSASGEVEFKYTQTSSKALYIKSIAITYENGPVKETVATPVISPASKEFNKGETVNVSITTKTEGATIHYTTNGDTPTVESAVYSAPFDVDCTTTIKAIAVKDDYNNSEVASATYTMIDPNAKTGTISFASTAQRVSQSTSQQVWSYDKITFTNNKGSSQTNVADYSKPVRLYEGSSIVIESSGGNITQILFDCNSAEYATELKNSIGDAATVTVSDDKVTVILDGKSNRFEIAKLTKQVRLDELTVTYTAGATKPVTPTLTAGGNFVGSMEVEISCATDGVGIYYTTDGNDPTKESKSYNGAFEITETTTVKAIAFNEAGESSVATAVYTRVAAAPTISFTESTFEESVVVTITAAEGTSAYYTLNGKTPKEGSDECPKTLTLRADATLQVIAYDEDGYASSIVKQTFTKKANDTSGTAGTATLVTDAADLAVGDKVVIVGSEEDKNYALSTNQKTNNRAAVVVEKSGSSVNLNDDVQILTLKSGLDNVGFSFDTGTGYLYAASNDANQLKTSNTQTDQGSFTIEIANDGVATIKAVNTGVRGLLRFNYDNGNPLFSCYSSGQSDVSLYKVNLSSVEDYELEVTAAGWSTLYLGYNVVIPEDVACYVISEVGEGSVILEEVTGVLPANTAVIVEAGEGEYTFEVTEESATVKSIMAGTTKNEYVDKDAYVLGKVGDEVGLYKAQMMGGVFLNNANKAYLPATAVQSNAKALKFNFDTTGVEGVKVETAGKKVIYDLSGRRVNDMTAPGLYIVNGKKVMVK